MTDLAGSPLPASTASPTKKAAKRAPAKPSSDKPVKKTASTEVKKSKKSKDGLQVRIGQEGEKIVIDPSYRKKLRVRGHVHVKEPLEAEYSSLGHHKARILQLAKAEGLGAISYGASRIISHNATELAIQVLQTAASFACHQQRTMINDNDIKNAYATLAVPIKFYSYGTLKKNYSHKRTFTNCKIDIKAAAKRRPHEQQFPVVVKVQKSTPAPAKKNKSRPQQ